TLALSDSVTCLCSRAHPGVHTSSIVAFGNTSPGVSLGSGRTACAGSKLRGGIETGTDDDGAESSLGANGTTARLGTPALGATTSTVGAFGVGATRRRTQAPTIDPATK